MNKTSIVGLPICYKPSWKEEKNMSSSREKVYNAIIDYTKEYSYPPTVREIGKMTGLKSSATVHTHIKRLESDGRIRGLDRKPRTLVTHSTDNNVKVLEMENGHPTVIEWGGHVYSYNTN